MKVGAAMSVDDLRAFCARAIPQPTGFDRTMINEAAFGLSRLQRLVASLSGRDSTLLEVGAGSLMLSSYLAARGFDVTAVEPADDAFEAFRPLQDAMIAAARREGAAPTVVASAIEDARIRSGFDVVFSINALEHVADPWRALDVMYGALRPGGTLLVHCPNYDVPFDSHFGIVLVTRSKGLNERLYARRIGTRPSLWDGLRFVRSTDVRRYCASRGYAVAFNRSMLRDAVRRLRADPVFAERMPWFVRRVGGLLSAGPLAAALASVPVRWQTPMEFTLSRPANAS
jgi:SAM-dependent methyltransferase